MVPPSLDWPVGTWKCFSSLVLHWKNGDNFAFCYTLCLCWLCHKNASITSAVFGTQQGE